MLVLKLARHPIAVGALMIAGCATAMSAPYTAIPLPLDALNIDLTTWSSGIDYVGLFHGTRTTAGGVPFALQTNAAGNDALYDLSNKVIQTGVYGARVVYTLINSSYGTRGSDIGKLTFTGSAGASYSVELIEGQNVRDHVVGGWMNSVSAPYVTTSVFGNAGQGRAHLDMQAFLLPSIFENETLQSITFNSNHLSTVDGRPFLAGLTVSTAVPEPQGVILALVGMGIVSRLTCRKNRSS